MVDNSFPSKPFNDLKKIAILEMKIKNFLPGIGEYRFASIKFLTWFKQLIASVTDCLPMDNV